jgi:hypothetical protein
MIITQMFVVHVVQKFSFILRRENSNTYLGDRKIFVVVVFFMILTSTKIAKPCTVVLGIRLVSKTDDRS